MEKRRTGVSHWKLEPDENADADPKINWREGQMPDTVNNSARMMMSRIKEEFDITHEGINAVSDNMNYVEAKYYNSYNNSHLYKDIAGIGLGYDINLTKKQYTMYMDRVPFRIYFKGIVDKITNIINTNPSKYTFFYIYLSVYIDGSFQLSIPLNIVTEFGEHCYRMDNDIMNFPDALPPLIIENAKILEKPVTLIYNKLYVTAGSICLFKAFVRNIAEGNNAQENYTYIDPLWNDGGSLNISYQWITRDKILVTYDSNDFMVPDLGPFVGNTGFYSISIFDPLIDRSRKNILNNLHSYRPFLITIESGWSYYLIKPIRGSYANPGYFAIRYHFFIDIENLIFKYQKAIRIFFPVIYNNLIRVPHRFDVTRPFNSDDKIDYYRKYLEE